MGFINALLDLLSAGKAPTRNHSPRSAGDRCPCGRGHIRRTTSRKYGDFLGCTAWRDDGRGCNNAWKLDGRRLPR